MSNDQGTLNVTGNPGSGRPTGGNGNNGGHSQTSGSGNGGKRKFKPGDTVAKSVGDNLAKEAGLESSIFKNYFINDDGDVIGVRFVDGSPTHPPGATIIGTYGVNLGPPPSDTFNGTGNAGSTPAPVLNSNIKFILSSPIIKPTGEISDSRINTLEKTIASFKLDAESGQSGNRVKNAKKETNKAKAELDLISTIKEKNIKDENDFLLKTSDILSGVGKDVAKKIGETYENISNEITSSIRNFKGKKIRSYDEALKSINKIVKNPAMAINPADKKAIENAINALNAGDIANKLKGIAKSFTIANLAVKAENFRQKLITGIETGNWGPLVLEVESWVVSGIVAGGALAILTGFIAPFLAGLLGLPLTAITITGIILIGIAASFIDDKLVDRINNELIKPAN